MESQNQTQLPEFQFSQLVQPPTLNEEFIHYLNQNIKSSDWTISYQCITMIRSINKYYIQFLPDIMEKYSLQLLDLISNGKTQIVKNILRLLKEVFLMGQQVNVQKVISTFLPILLKKASNEIGHIKDISQEVLTAFSQNCGYQASYLISAQLCCDKNTQISQISIKLFANMIQNTGNMFTQLSSNTLQTIMKCLSFLIDGKRPNMKTWALDICIFIYNTIGSQNYLNLMNFSLQHNQVILMGKSMETHRVSKVKPQRLSAMIKHRRSTMKIRQSYNNFNGIQNNFANSNMSFNQFN